MTVESNNNQEAEKKPEIAKQVVLQAENTKTEPDEANENGDPNWKIFREQRKKDRDLREAAERRAQEKESEAAALRAAMEAAFAKESRSESRSKRYEEDEEETEDQRIEKKVQAALAARDRQYEQDKYQREQKEYPERLKKSYSDFDSVVAAENLDYLEYHYPEVAAPLKRLPDGYDKWSDIYRAVRKFVPNATSAKKEAAKAEANLTKPKSISSTGVTQPGEAKGAHILSEEKRAANWERMQKTLKGLI